MVHPRPAGHEHRHDVTRSQDVPTTLPERALRRLPRELLDAPVRGVGLRGDTVAAEVGDEPTVWIFLRHFG